MKYFDILVIIIFVGIMLAFFGGIVDNKILQAIGGGAVAFAVTRSIFLKTKEKQKQIQICKCGWDNVVSCGNCDKCICADCGGLRSDNGGWIKE